MYPTHFNPRSREGSDKDTKMPLEGATFISIHAPAKGATTEFTVSADCFLISIHAPVKGATGSHPRDFPVSIISIHAPVKGATFGLNRTLDRPRISIHAPVKGATLIVLLIGQRQGAFQSTLP